MSKKSLLCLLSVLLIVFGVLNVEIASAADGADSAPVNLTKPVNLLWATTGIGMADYSDASVIGALMQKALPEGSNVTIETISPGLILGSYMVESGRADIVNVFMYPTYKTGLNGRPPVKGIKALCATAGDGFVLQCLSKKFVDESGYSSIEDIVANKHPVKIVTKTVGTSGEMGCRDVLAALGVTYDDVRSWGGDVILTDTASGLAMLQDGQVDMVLDFPAPTNVSYVELIMNTEVVMPPFKPETLQTLIDDFGYVAYKTPPNSFSGGVPEPIDAVRWVNSFVVSEKMDDDVAYTLIKCIIENYTTIAEQVNNMRNWTPEMGCDTSATIVDIHPGAARYYREIGAMK